MFCLSELTIVCLIGQEPAPAAPAPLFSGYTMFFAATVFLFYSLVLAPERRKRAEAEHLRTSLKKNDRVVTAGGIHGTIAAIDDDHDLVTVKVDGNTRLKINRSAIASVIEDKVVDASTDKNT